MDTTIKVMHTEGPWTIINGVFVAVEATDEYICRVETDRYYKGECAANARLIAAAPELFEALECTLRQLRTVTHNWTDDQLNNSIIDQAVLAIRKAKGVE